MTTDTDNNIEKELNKINANLEKITARFDITNTQVLISKFITILIISTIVSSSIIFNFVNDYKDWNIHGINRSLTFIECIYLNITTYFTVGIGIFVTPGSDIKPISTKAKIFIICNLLWVILIIRYTIYEDTFIYLSFLEYFKI